jgi:hypothetical protein
VAKKAQAYSPITFVKPAQGKVTYTNASSAAVSKAITVSKSSGVVTVKKGVKAGAYPVKITVAAAGNANYQPLSKTVTAKVVVK